MRHLRIERVVWIGITEERLQRDKRGTQVEHRRPGFLDGVEGDGAGGRGDVRVVDLGDELHLGWFQGIVTGDDDVLRCRAMRDESVSEVQWLREEKSCGAENSRLRSDRPYKDCLVGLRRSREDGRANCRSARP